MGAAKAIGLVPLKDFPSVMRDDDGVGVAEGEGGEALARGRQAVAGGGAVVRGVADRDRAEAGAARRLDTVLDRAVAGEVAEGIAGVEMADPRPALLVAQPRALVDPSAFERFDIVGEQQDAVAVGAARRGFEERARHRGAGGLVGPGGGEHIVEEPRQLRRSGAPGRLRRTDVMPGSRPAPKTPTTTRHRPA